MTEEYKFWGEPLTLYSEVKDGDLVVCVEANLGSCLCEGHIYEVEKTRDGVIYPKCFKKEGYHYFKDHFRLLHPMTRDEFDSLGVGDEVCDCNGDVEKIQEFGFSLHGSTMKGWKTQNYFIGSTNYEYLYLVRKNIVGENKIDDSTSPKKWWRESTPRELSEKIDALIAENESLKVELEAKKHQNKAAQRSIESLMEANENYRREEQKLYRALANMTLEIYGGEG